MSLISILRTVFSFRLLAATLLLWTLFSTQSMAWQQVSYTPYPAYAAPVNYNPYAQPYGYPAYNYPRYYYPQPNYYTPPVSPTKLVKPVVKPEIKKATKPKIGRAHV